MREYPNFDISKGRGPVKDPRLNNITSHFEECGVNELFMHYSSSSSSALFSRLYASWAVDPMQ